MKDKKMIYADDLFQVLRDDININGANLARVRRHIEAAPAVDAVEVVHGRWVHPKGYVVSNGFICSECGHEEASYYPINPRPGGVCIADKNGNFYYPPKINYCPNCGAKMDGGNEDG